MLVDAPAVKNRLGIPRWVFIAIIAVLALVLGSLIYLLIEWPFTEAAVSEQLGGLFSSRVQIEQFRKTYFPHPGCVVEHVQIRDGSFTGRIDKLTIQASWPMLLAGQHRISRIVAEGLLLHVLPRGQSAQGAPPSQNTSRASKVVVDEVVADRSVLEIDRDGNSPLRFEIHELTVNNIGARRSMAYRVAMRNPLPPGEIRSSGSIGPWHFEHHERTPVSGDYTFDHADLGTFQYIAGTLSSKGHFTGRLEQIAVEGPLQISGFEVTSSRHRMDLTASFKAIVNGTNGDVTLQNVETHFAQTTIVSSGEIAGKPGQHGKTISLNMESKNGHIQDLMRMMMKSNRPPLAGSIGFRGHIVVPPDGSSILRRVEVDSQFGIGGAKFTAPQTQHNVDVLSERARGDKNDDANPEDVVSDVTGDVALRSGVAHFSNLRFRVPGARSRMAGTFNILNQEIDLGGYLAIEAELSQATKGFKSFLLKAVDPFFKKKHAGAVVPIHIGGTFGHPTYGLALSGKNHEEAEAAHQLQGKKREHRP